MMWSPHRCATPAGVYGFWAWEALVALIALVAAVLARLDMPSEQPAATEIGALAKAPATLAILPFVNFSEE